MSREIEKKYLVTNLPEISENIKRYEIIQGYVFITDSMELRLRKKSDKYFQTIKTGEGLNRGEFEIELSANQFDVLWPLTENKRVEKTRYEINHDGFLVELDVYSGSLAGLITAEVEFKSEDEIREFEPPDWFGEDVTGNEGYKNKNLSLRGRPGS